VSDPLLPPISNRRNVSSTQTSPIAKYSDLGSAAQNPSYSGKPSKENGSPLARRSQISPVTKIPDTETQPEQKRREQEEREAIIVARNLEPAAQAAARRRDTGRRLVDDRARIASEETQQLMAQVAALRRAEDDDALHRAWASLYDAARVGDAFRVDVLLRTPPCDPPAGGDNPAAPPGRPLPPPAWAWARSGGAARQPLVDAAGGKLNRTALHAACSAGHVEVVRLLIEEFGAALDPTDRCRAQPGRAQPAWADYSRISGPWYCGGVRRMIC
jgi:hypothetical protein